MDWKEFKKVLYDSIECREENKIVCKSEEHAKNLLISINKLFREGVILK